MFLVFHLTVLFLTPNKQSYFAYRLLHPLEPYIDFFEFSADWVFFSPDPAAPLSIEWKAFERSGKQIEEGVFPDSKGPLLWGDRHIRRLSAARFMLLLPGAPAKTLVPYVCRQLERAGKHPFSVRLTRVLIYPPPLLEVVKGKKDASEAEGSDRTDLGLEFCDSPKDSP